MCRVLGLTVRALAVRLFWGLGHRPGVTGEPAINKHIVWLDQCTRVTVTPPIGRRSGRPHLQAWRRRALGVVVDVDVEMGGGGVTVAGRGGCTA